jgi:hypothetical protein
MAIVQISKIQHRTGANTDLPQLDIGEIGFSTDTQQVFIGNDPVLVPIDTNVSFTTQTEILTEVSLINNRVANGTGNTKIFAPIAGAGNTVFNITNIRTGQLIVGDGDGIAANTLVNWTGNRLGNGSNVTTNKLKLGGVANIIITGGSSGTVLSTDGAGNLSWQSISAGGGSLPELSITTTGKFLTNDGSNTSWSNIFADSRLASAIKANISVTDSGGDGSLSYSNGVITYSGPTASDVRSHFSAGTGITYAANGQLSIGQDVATTANVTFDGITGSNLTLLSSSSNAVLYTSPSGNVVSSESDFTYNASTNTLNVGKLTTVGTIEVGTLFKSNITTQTGSSTGTPGQICWDTDYIYVCTSTNVWKRVALSSF